MGMKWEDEGDGSSSDNPKWNENLGWRWFHPGSTHPPLRTAWINTRNYVLHGGHAGGGHKCCESLETIPVIRCRNYRRVMPNGAMADDARRRPSLWFPCRRRSIRFTRPCHDFASRLHRRHREGRGRKLMEATELRGDGSKKWATVHLVRRLVPPGLTTGRSAVDHEIKRYRTAQEMVAHEAADIRMKESVFHRTQVCWVMNDANNQLT